MLIHTDCKYYKGAMPCDFHKKDGRLCDGCRDYARVGDRILIVKLAAVGDVLRTTSILPALKNKYTGCHITWVTKANASPLLKANPLLDRVLAIEDGYLEFISNEKFDIGICLDADPLSATILSLASCTTSFGFHADHMGRVEPVNDLSKPWWYMGLNDNYKKQNRKTYQQIMYEICDLTPPTYPPQLQMDFKTEQFGKEFVTRNGLAQARRLVGVNTGGGGRWQYKKWTFEGYVTFIKELKKRHSDLGILLLGGPEEIELNQQIIQSVGTQVVDTGCNNSLGEFASLINALDVLLTSDSLAMHIGVALGKSTIVLVGPTSPWELDVYGNGAIIHSDIECLVCYLSRCDKTVTCMNTLSPEYVLSTAEKFL